MDWVWEVSAATMHTMVAGKVLSLLRDDVISSKEVPDVHKLINSASFSIHDPKFNGEVELLGYGPKDFVESVQAELHARSRYRTQSTEINEYDQQQLKFIYRFEFLKILQEILPDERDERIKGKPEQIAYLREFKKRICDEFKVVNNEYALWLKSDVDEGAKVKDKPGFFKRIWESILDLIQSNEKKIVRYSLQKVNRVGLTAAGHMRIAEIIVSFKRLENELVLDKDIIQEGNNRLFTLENKLNHSESKNENSRPNLLP